MSDHEPSYEVRQALQRPLDYAALSARTQWDIDNRLGILDWEPTREEIADFERLWAEKVKAHNTKTRRKPAQSLDGLPWSTDFPDQEGWWWFRAHSEFELTIFVGKVGKQELLEKRLYLSVLNHDPIDKEKWDASSIRCCPVVIEECS